LNDIYWAFDLWSAFACDRWRHFNIYYSKGLKALLNLWNILYESYHPFQTFSLALFFSPKCAERWGVAVNALTSPNKSFWMSSQYVWSITLTWRGAKNHLRGISFRIRPHHTKCTRSHPNSEVKLYWAQLVLWWGTTWEHCGVVSILPFWTMASNECCMSPVPLGALLLSFCTHSSHPLLTLGSIINQMNHNHVNPYFHPRVWRTLCLDTRYQLNPLARVDCTYRRTIIFNINVRKLI